MSTFGLTQVVDNYTNLYRDNCHSLIDLVLLSNPSFLSSCQTIPPLSNSDHLGIWVEIKMKHANKTVRPPWCSVWHYSQADWDRACERIETFDWDAWMVEDINLSCTGRKMKFPICPVDMKSDISLTVLHQSCRG